MSAPKFRYFAMSMLLPNLLYLNPVLAVMPEVSWVGRAGQLVCGSALLMNIALSVLMHSDNLPKYSMWTRLVLATAMLAVYFAPLFGGTRFIEAILHISKWLSLPGASEALFLAHQNIEASIQLALLSLSSSTMWIDVVFGIATGVAAVSVVTSLVRHFPRAADNRALRALILGGALIAAQWTAFYMRFDFSVFNLMKFIWGALDPVPAAYSFLVPLILLIAGTVLAVAPSRKPLAKKRGRHRL